VITTEAPSGASFQSLKSKTMAEVSYIKNDSYTDMVKLENHVWYGLQKVLGKEFCKTGYFKKYWDEVKSGKFIHEIDGVIIDVDRDRGIRIERMGSGSIQVQPEVEKPSTKKDGGKVEKPKSVPTGGTQFGKVTETGKGECCISRFYHKGQHVGYLDTTMLNDETLETGLELAKNLKVSLLEIHVTKDWYCAVAQGKPDDYL